MSKELSTETPRRRPWWRNEWVIIVAIVGVLHATDTLVVVQSTLQRMILATGLFSPDFLADHERIPARPALVVTTDDSTTLSTDSLAGEVMFVNAWATWCAPCLAEMPSIDALHRDYGDRVRFLMVNLDDDPEVGIRFMRDRGYSLPVHRPGGRIPAWLDVSLIPSTVVITRDGNIAAAESGMSRYDSAEFRAALDRLLATALAADHPRIRDSPTRMTGPARRTIPAVCHTLRGRATRDTGMRTRIIIAGAAGRDFHDFNTRYRHRDDVEVVAFTATQIPNIEGRVYPPELAGPNYPLGIPIFAEDHIERMVREHAVDQVVFSYSDVSYDQVLSLGSRVLATGADFLVPGPQESMLSASCPVIAVCAMRTGAGKSPTTRHVAGILEAHGARVVVIRHPMPYGDLAKQAVQRFAEFEDLDRHRTTIEEREEYEPHLAEGRIVYAGVDYGAILRAAEREADVILWDGGNNDLPFYRPDLHIVVLDPLRAGDVCHYHPGEVNVRMADLFVVNKIGTATPEQIDAVEKAARERNARAPFIRAFSPAVADDPEALRDKRVLVVEDGPTLTHGGMTFGAGVVAARAAGAREIVDPRPWAVGTIARTFERYPGTGPVLPAMGYGDAQIKDLQKTIDAVKADVVVVATPIDLRRVMRIRKPAVRVRYHLEPAAGATLEPYLLAALVSETPVAHGVPSP